MKRSRIFLTITTVCLAIAGVAATKASNFTSNSKILVGAQCQNYTTNCTNMGANTCHTSAVAGAHTVFTSGGCANKIKYNTVGQ